MSSTWTSPQQNGIKATIYYTTTSSNTGFTVKIEQIAFKDTMVGMPQPVNAKLYLYLAGTTKVNGTSITFKESGASTAATYTTDQTQTLNKTHAAQTFKVQIKLTFSREGQSKTFNQSTSFSVPAKPSYTITYAANGGSSTPGNQTKWYGENLTLQPGISRANASAGTYTLNLNLNDGTTNKSTLSAARTTKYTFGSWKSSADGKTYASKATYSYDGKGSTMTAQWSSSTSTGTVTLPSKTWSGYSFKCWNTNTTNTGTPYNANTSYTPPSNGYNLYAIWNRTVTFNANGGTGAPSAQTNIRSTAITLSTTKPSWSGNSYSFKEWYTNTSDSGGTAYQPGGSYPVNQPNITLYAIWNRTVTFNANGGNGAPNAQTGLKTAAITLSTTRPSWDGYNFVRWNTNTSNTGTPYNPGDSYPKDNPNITLYAIWERTLTYNANGGSLGNVATQKTDLITNAITIDANQPTRNNYIFNGWATTSGGTASYQPNGSYAVNEPSQELFAVWAPEASITNVTRTDINGNSDIFGGYVKVDFTYTNEAQQCSIQIAATGKTYTQSYQTNSQEGIASGSVILGEGSLSTIHPENAYTITLTVPGGTQTGGSTVRTQTLAKTNYTRPLITSILTERVNQNYQLADDGTFLRLSVNWSVFNASTQVANMIVSAKDENNIDVDISLDQPSLNSFSGNPSVFYFPATNDGYRYILTQDTQVNQSKTYYSESNGEYLETTVQRYIYTPTSDLEIDSSKDYYIYSNDEYVIVTEPIVENISTYYEQILNNPKNIYYEKVESLGLFDTDKNYTITIKLSDVLGESVATTKSDILSKAFFTMDVLGDVHRFQPSIDTTALISKLYYEKTNEIYEPIDFSEYDNLMQTTSETLTETYDDYIAYDVAIDEWLEEGQEYTLQLWDVDVSHSGKSVEDLGVSAYYCGGRILLGGFYGTSYFTDGHADYLTLTFTPRETTIDTSTAGEHSSSGPSTAGLNYTDVTNASFPFFRFYNSVGNVSGTKSMTIGSWKLEKGSEGTEWTHAVGDFNPVEEEWYEKNGPRPGYGVAFGMPATEEGFHLGYNMTLHNIYDAEDAFITIKREKGGIKDTGFKLIRDDSGTSAGFIIGTDGFTHGIYSWSLNKWLINTNGTSTILHSGAGRFDKNDNYSGILTLGDGTNKQATIRYHGPKAPQKMIRFLPNNNDIYGNGIVIGAGSLSSTTDESDELGGTVVIGSGESAGHLVGAIPISPSMETTYIASDGNIEFYTNCNNIANRRKMVMSGTSFDMYSSANTSGTTVSSMTSDPVIHLKGTDGTTIAQFLARFQTDGREGLQLEAYRKSPATWHGIGLYIDASGKRSVAVSESLPWRNALGASNGIWPVSLGGTGQTTPIYNNTISNMATASSGWTIQAMATSRWGHVLTIYAEFKHSSAISVAANGGITDVTAAVLKAGYRPVMLSAGWDFEYDGCRWNIDGNGNIGLRSAEATGAARTIAANTVLRMRSTYVFKYTS